MLFSRRSISTPLLFFSLLINIWIIIFHVSDKAENTICETQRNTLINTIKFLEKSCVAEATDTHSDDDQSERSEPIHLLGNITDSERQRAFLLGHSKVKKGFLTIGIPTVWRKDTSYLYQTLDSLVNHSNLEERKEITIVVLVADFNHSFASTTCRVIKGRFSEQVNSGFIQVIQAPQGFYPKLTGLKRNYGDPEERVKWRSKQVMDFVYLFTYSSELSRYYLQLEDDVIASSGYFSAIRDYISTINEQAKQWVCLEFSELGFIGKLFRADELRRFAAFSTFFYQDQPIDYLLKYYMVLSGQTQSHLRLPSLFQHIGRHSSLLNKDQKLQDRFFDDSPKKYKSDNPPAKIYTNLVTFNTFTAQLAYSLLPGYFWGKSPKTGNQIVIVFDEPVKIDQIAVETGHNLHPADILKSGTLELSRGLKIISSMDSLPQCFDYMSLGNFQNGHIELKGVYLNFKLPVKCIRILVTQDQNEWLIVREIAVWIHK